MARLQRGDTIAGELVEDRATSHCQHERLASPAHEFAFAVRPVEVGGFEAEAVEQPATTTSEVDIAGHSPIWTSLGYYLALVAIDSGLGSTVSTGVLDVDLHPATRWANLPVKIGLLLSFAVAIGLSPDTVDGKAMGFRAPLFLAPAVLVPVIARVRGWDPYPHTADALLAAPFLIDTLGNLLGVYDDFPQADDVLHALNWVLLVGAFHAFRFRTIDDRRDAVLLGYGFGAIAIVWWDIMEWAVSEDGFGGAGSLSLTYEDTVGDLFLSSTGGLVGSLIAVWWLGPRRVS